MYGREGGMMRPPFRDGKFGVYSRMLGEGVDRELRICKPLLLRWREMDCWYISFSFFL